ncbi:MAG: motility protein A [Anaerovoracaceae bacterium]|jgi:chemotaxis protein MotA
MEITILIGYIAAILAIMFGIVFSDGGFDFTLLLNFISGPSIFIVFGGTFFVLMASFPMKIFRLIPKHLSMIFMKDKKDPNEYIEIITDLSKEARRKGLLALEEKALTFEDDFLKESVLLIVDAIEPDKLKSWFEQKVANIERQNAEERKLYDMGATLAPAFGMLGTLVGLVNMLKSMNLDDGGATLGLNMSVALITTFYGSLLANCFFIPMGNKLELAQERELLYKDMIIEGIISIKEGENPRYIEEKLKNFLADYELQKEGDETALDEEDDGTGKKGKRARRVWAKKE